jgi:fumarate hydratase class II
MIAVQVMSNDLAVGFGGAGGYLEMNVYKPLMIYNVIHSITIMADGCTRLNKSTAFTDCGGVRLSAWWPRWFMRREGASP